MGRPPAITDDEILAAARAVVLEQGVTATVEDVARRCGVGVATIFRRFPTKQQLFGQALDADLADGLRRLEERAQHPDARANLVEVARIVIEAGRRKFPLLMMRMANPEFATELSRREGAFRRAMKGFTEFFAAQIDAGRVRAKDPRVAARIFLGSIQNFILFEGITKGADALPAEDLAEGLADLLCAPRPTRRTPPRAFLRVPRPKPGKHEGNQ
jgi:AcrR family transcriptional regulator